MEDAISFDMLGEVPLAFVAESALCMFFVEIRLVTPRWTSFFGLAELQEVDLNEARCTAASADIAEGEPTPLPWLEGDDHMSALYPHRQFC